MLGRHFTHCNRGYALQQPFLLAQAPGELGAHQGGLEQGKQF